MKIRYLCQKYPFCVGGFVPKWQHQKFREASCRGIEMLTQQWERENEMVISEMWLPLHCVINKSVNLPTQTVQETHNMESRCLPWAPAHLGISCIHGLCSVPEHTPCTSQVKNFPFVPLLSPALRWRHSWGLGLGWCPLQLHCWFSGR